VTTFEQAWAAVDGVDGWMSIDQAAELYEAAAACAAGGRIVEIGSFRGRSTIVLALAATPDTAVTAIDPHAGNDRGPQEIAGFEAEADDDHDAFVANLRNAGVIDRVNHLRMFSDDALEHVEGSIDVLYIDGAHRYRPARTDIERWGARVADGGTMLIHDSFSSVGVTLAILRALVPGTRFRYVGRARSLAVYRAEPMEAFEGRCRNVGRQLAQLPWFAKNVALKALLAVGFGKLLARIGRPVPEWPY
jgi:predicted O-methyltransferase YrrM